jgi:cobalt/nickel transport system ATP-binding protein
VEIESKSDIIFDLQDVSYSYEKANALCDVSLQIKRGERTALLGANGSGKSTLIRLLAALSFPVKGSLAFFGKKLTASQLEDPEFFYSFRRRVGIIFQNPDIQLFNASVFDEVAFAPLQLGWPRNQIRDAVLATLAAMNIDHLRDRPPHRLSGGEKKRVALASVLVLDPEILLLDEPTAGLDPSSAAQIVNILSSWKGTEKTVITATHDLDVLEEIADRCCVLESGRFVADETPLTLVHDVALMERTSLVRAHPHSHSTKALVPHPHIHQHEA